MKVLLVNKFFFPFGGSETSFFQTAELLEKRGHQVVFFSMDHPKNIPVDGISHFVPRIDFEAAGSFGEKLNGLRRILYAPECKRELEKLLACERPDIAHLHNVYHHLPVTMVPVLKKRGIPVVMTLHDYKPVCPAYKLFVRGLVCERCRNRRFHWCLLKKCVKDSRLKSLVCSIEVDWHRKYYDQIDLFICPSRFLQEKIRSMGLAGASEYIPNFHLATPAQREPAWPPYLLYSGRLVEEKGLPVLIQAMETLPLDCLIAGEGPMRSSLERMAERTGNGRIRFLGHLPFAELKPLIEGAFLTVMPSIWYENNPFAIIESFAHGVPVVASRIGGIPELVIDGDTGYTFRPGDPDDLRSKVIQILNDPEKRRSLGERAQAMVADRFHPDRYIDDLLHVYQRLIDGRPPQCQPPREV